MRLLGDYLLRISPELIDQTQHKSTKRNESILWIAEFHCMTVTGPTCHDNELNASGILKTSGNSTAMGSQSTRYGNFTRVSHE